MQRARHCVAAARRLGFLFCSTCFWITFLSHVALSSYPSRRAPSAPRALPSSPCGYFPTHLLFISPRLLPRADRRCSQSERRENPSLGTLSIFEFSRFPPLRPNFKISFCAPKFEVVFSVGNGRAWPSLHCSPHSHSRPFPQLDFLSRHVILPKEIAKLVPQDRLMTETEWRNIGVQQSRGWVHYMIHRPGTKERGVGIRRFLFPPSAHRCFFSSSSSPSSFNSLTSQSPTSCCSAASGPTLSKHEAVPACCRRPPSTTALGSSISFYAMDS